MRAVPSLLIFFMGLCFYALMNYGGVRTSDGEIVFRVGESLESDLTFEVAEDLGAWPEFGVARGEDGKLYSVFGPGQSILSSVLIKLAKGTNYDAWFRSPRAHLPLSYYLPDSWRSFISKSKPEDMAPHALRFVVSYLYIGVSALGLVMFWLITRKMVSAPLPSFSVTVLYGFGTLALPYSGTFLSEPLANLFVLTAFYFLVCRDPRFQGAAGSKSTLALLPAGLSLGAATATHITAVLFFPFFLFYCAHFCGAWGKDWRDSVKPVALFVSGFALVCLLLGYYNYSRFGTPFQTGRTVDLYGALTLGYGRFVSPWTGLYGLLLGPGKGILLFCPAVLLGVVSWRCFHRSYPALSYALAGAALFRIVFIACRSDWHGGFCLGPRYLLMLIPFLLIPIVFWLKEQSDRNNKTAIRLFAAFSLICISQQLYFSIGEIFSYYHILKLETRSLDVGLLYLRWSSSPLFRLLNFERGPFLLQGVPVSNVSLWIIATALMTMVLGIGWFSTSAHRRREST